MKELLFWLALMEGIVALIGSCAKKDEKTATTAATSCVTSTTASGSTTVGSGTLSGTYVSECNASAFAAAAGTSIFPSDVASGRTVMVVTGDTTFSDEMFMFTDASCSTPSATIKNGRDNVTVGSASGDYYLVTYDSASFKVTAHTAVARDNLTAALIGNITDIDLTVGEEFSTAGSGNLYMNLWSVTSTTIETGEEDRSTQPTVIDSMVMTKE